MRGSTTGVSLLAKGLASSTEVAEMDDTDGKCIWSPEYASCEILLNKRQPDTAIPHTIVHELVHLALQGHKENHCGYSAMYERGINRIATAILR